jgi:2-polyprenyl-6-methoxyphenol hydroxylase-like FAD-dependent oxidoreductase
MAIPATTSPSSSTTTAVVIGGSMAGLLAAAALSPTMDRVVVVERDTLPAGPELRRGTPQAWHAHGVLAAGRDAMESLLPGLTHQLIERGATSEGDIGSNTRWWIGGGLLAPTEVGSNGVAVSRVVLEATVRERVRALPNVVISDAVDVLGLLVSGRRLTGVRVLGREDGAVAEGIAADLVVDATGRSGRAATWLHDLGYVAPAEEEVHVGIRYASGRFPARPGDNGGLSVIVQSATPSSPRGAAAIREDDGTWVVLLYGYLDDAPPIDLDGFRAFARSLVSIDVAPLVADRDPLGRIRPYHFPASRRRRFERLARLPEGYVAIGDAICSFNPAFGQGMSVAALEALALRGEVAGGLMGVGQRFHRRAASIVDGAWDVVVGADLQISGVRGSRPPGHTLISRYVHRAQLVARHDPVVATRVLRITNLLAPPASLLAPRIAWRVLRRPRGGSPPSSLTPQQDPAVERGPRGGGGTDAEPPAAALR